MDRQMRRRWNQKFVERLMQRHPKAKEKYGELLKKPLPEAPPPLEGLEPEGVEPADPRDMIYEAIVREERPVLFVQDGQFNKDEVTKIGVEAEELVNRLVDASPKIHPLLPLVGRVDVVNFPGDFLGTGWFIDNDIVVTNRHVASLIARWDGRKFAFSKGVAGRTISSSICNAHEYDDPPPAPERVFKVLEVLYIEPDSGPNDIAFLRVERRAPGNEPSFIPIAASDVDANVPVCVVGYPARAPRNIIPNQQLMQDLYRGRYDVKRVAPGLSMPNDRGSATHDCTTLGGNSGSVVLDLASGRAVGLHFAGIYQEANFAVRASVLNEYVRGRRWTRPPSIETREPAAPSPAVPQSSAAVTLAGGGAGSVSFTLPLTITLSLGTARQVGAAAVAGGSSSAPTVARAEAAARAFWHSRPDGALGVRVGFLDEGDDIGDVPCIAVSVAPSRLGEAAGGPKEFMGVPVRYLPADVEEQLEALPIVESVDSIAYDDDARKAKKYSFDHVDEEMTVTLHVGPEYSWDVLKKFLEGATTEFVSAMYEFHADHIRKTIQERLQDQVKMKLVLDNATFSARDETFDQKKVFKSWADKYDFERIVAPEGTSGLISDSYHIKVTVRDGDSFWLSSGNWKAGSSQPVISQQERDDATEQDLPGNREWHVTIENAKLAERFRSHILQDFERSADLGGRELPKSMIKETFVDVPMVEAPILERRPPSRILLPKKLEKKRIKVKPLLTPDREGEVYCEAVLALIRSANESLLFQIPYIGMPSDPTTSRGYIDDLIGELTNKLRNLDDARVLLRGGQSAGKRYSAPTFAAWHFKSKGVDPKRIRTIENHHTKGMIVDGRRVLIGSHNWSKPGVTLNRDASLLFDDPDVASYYAEAFEIDWERSNPVKPRPITEAPVFEAVAGTEPRPGYERVPLSEWLKDD